MAGACAARPRHPCGAPGHHPSRPKQAARISRACQRRPSSPRAGRPATSRCIGARMGWAMASRARAGALAEGRDVLFNGSRAALAEALAAFPDLQVILITARRTRCWRGGLAARGRESGRRIMAARLARAGFALPPGSAAQMVVNDGTPEDGLARLLRRASAGQGHSGAAGGNDPSAASPNRHRSSITKGRGRTGAKCASRRWRPRPPVHRQPVGQGQVEAEFLHHEGIAPKVQQFALARGQGFGAAAGDLGLGQGARGVSSAATTAGGQGSSGAPSHPRAPAPESHQGSPAPARRR